ncbi:hypothetical protein [Shewanella cyperi]|uniref:Lipoprotein n=1 Tax=Shewanella cyperi TaxID=2814292 RepID=A0A974XNY9_9GAMM|nr:hypothetical protein [Shewanella cyperi]QSX31881.1 hypothetical protein JYB88_10910 [Shewanella cyperi]QSX42642.1 hypothetical protein JYB84_10780 [Shewanella cyperi]
MLRIILIALLLLSGCRQQDDSATNLTPEQVSLGFFRAIYVDRDVEKATQFVDAPLKEVLRHYYIAASVQRHMLNLSMTDVEMEIDEIDIDFFRKFTKDVTVIVKLKGIKAGEPWIDDRTLRLHKRGNEWIIVEVMKEKRIVNG